jgi:hypothetical protein
LSGSASFPFPTTFTPGAWYRIVLDVTITESGSGSRVVATLAEREASPRTVVDASLSPTFVGGRGLIAAVGLVFVRGPIAAQRAHFDDVAFDWKR